MVNEKQTKRERNIKSKLMAAIAMLLVSSIMMVSTTYAWFTLSTAPEVTGITTSIASNGNLEIALSPVDGVGANVGDATTATGSDWTVKNLTWGNLVDMSSATYGLSELVLAPAQLALSGADGAFTLGTEALAVPVYGSDGRINTLKPDAFIAAKGADGKYSATADEMTYGVRAVGTASSLSPQEKALRAALNAINSNITAALSSVNSSLIKNGDALAAMLVLHAQVEGTDENDYAQYVPAVATLVNGLDTALTNIDAAVRGILSAATVKLSNEVPEATDENQAPVSPFAAADLLINGKTGGVYTNSITDVIDELEDAGVTIPPQVQSILDAREAISEDIAEPKAKAAALLTSVDANGDGQVDADAPKVTWTQLGGALTSLMDTSGTITICGYSITEVKTQLKENMMAFAAQLAANTVIELGEGSGVYYDIATIIGNVSASLQNVNVTVNGYGTIPVPLVTIKTVATSAALPAAYDHIQANSDGEGEAFTPVAGDAAAAIDTNYGYVIDLMVRTNAAQSKLLLQTDPAQRVYDDSSNAATMGKGTSISFVTTDANNVAALTKLCNSIRVLFFEPKTNEVYGLAKVVEAKNLNPDGVAKVENGVAVMDDDGNPVLEYTVIGYLELCQIAGTTIDGVYKAGDVVDSTVLCDLTQNTPTAVSAMVYLDGETVTSRDVLANENATGYLNLQFASDANLEPMMNSDLYSGDANTPAAPEGGEG